MAAFKDAMKSAFVGWRLQNASKLAANRIERQNEGETLKMDVRRERMYAGALVAAAILMIGLPLAAHADSVQVLEAGRHQPVADVQRNRQFQRRLARAGHVFWWRLHPG